MPSAMNKKIKKIIPSMESHDKISFGIKTFDKNETPEFEKGDKLSCGGSVIIKEVITFVC